MTRWVARPNRTGIAVSRAPQTISAGKCSADFDAVGRRYPLESAQLWIAMTAEVALMELANGGELPSARSALEQFLG